MSRILDHENARRGGRALGIPTCPTRHHRARRIPRAVRAPGHDLRHGVTGRLCAFGLSSAMASLISGRLK